MTPEQADQILEACPTMKLKLTFALARYAGLRTPSETRLLTWRDIEWKRGRLTVRSPKTERFAGHEQRIVPITPKLMKLLQDAFDALEEGADGHLVTISSTGWAHTALRDAIRDAGLEPWDDLFQTLRRSCEIEWAQSFPQFAVSKWIGHSILVSGRHYANLIPETLFAEATGLAKGKVAQKAAQSLTEMSGNALQVEKNGGLQKEHNPAGCRDLQQPAGLCREWRGGESNPHLSLRRGDEAKFSNWKIGSFLQNSKRKGGATWQASPMMLAA